MFCSLLVSVSLAAAATPPAEPWEDGLTMRAPTRPFVAVQGASLLGQDTVVFADLRAGASLWTSRNQRAAVGLTAQVSTSSVWTADGRAATGLRSLGPGLWFSFSGAERRSVHSVVVRYRTGVSELIRTGWYRTSASELGLQVALVYDGYADLGPLHLSSEVRLGVAESTIIDLGGSMVALVPIGDRFAVGAGTAVGSLGTVVSPSLMVRVRPADGVEMGLSGVLPIVDVVAAAPYPALDLKAYW